VVKKIERRTNHPEGAIERIVRNGGTQEVAMVGERTVMTTRGVVITSLHGTVTAKKTGTMIKIPIERVQQRSRIGEMICRRRLAQMAKIPKSEGAPNIRAVLKDAMIATAIEMEIGIARNIEMRAESHQNIVPRNARGKDEKVTNPNVIRKNCLRTSCTTLERKHYFPQRFYSIHPMTTSHTTIIFASICTAAKGSFLKI